MRIFDLTKLAVKTVKIRRALLPLLGMAVAAFCLCFAGAILIKVQEEKAQPYELILSAQGNTSITDNAIANILKVPDVKAATSILQVPVTIQTDKYTAQLTLTGLDADYFDSAVSQGSIFPAESVMPYILLNEAACKQFAEEGKEPETEAPDIVWLNASYSLSTDSEHRITSKVCGILTDGNTPNVEPAAYVSLAVAKALLRQSGQPTEVTTTWVRISNIGCTKAVSQQIAALGLSVVNSNEQLQTEWDAEMKEMVYLLVIAAFCLACAALTLASNRAMMMEQQKRIFDHLRWMGMKNRDMTHLLMLHALIITVLGTAIGIIISMSLPSFLPPEQKGTSSYTLSIPFVIAVASLVACILIGVIPAYASKKRQPPL